MLTGPKVELTRFGGHRCPSMFNAHGVPGCRLRAMAWCCQSRGSRSSPLFGDALEASYEDPAVIPDQNIAIEVSGDSQGRVYRSQDVDSVLV